MKIKTITSGNSRSFDEMVNEAMRAGYQLVRRDIIPGFRLDGGSYLHNMLYAELVLPDPPAEPEQIDPFQALRQVQEFCHSFPVEKCNAGDCPLRYWCAALEGGGDPTDWALPEVEI